MGLPSGVGRVEASSATVEAHELIFKIVFRSDFFRFWMDFGRFWEVKMEPQIEFLHVFLRCFFRVRFGIVLECVFGGSEPQKTGFRLRGVLIFTKSAFSKNHSKKLNFGSVWGGQSHQKSMKNRVRNYHFF